MGLPSPVLRKRLKRQDQGLMDDLGFIVAENRSGIEAEIETVDQSRSITRRFLLLR
jgi:hypothetical protein